MYRNFRFADTMDFYPCLKRPLCNTIMLIAFGAPQLISSSNACDAFHSCIPAVPYRTRMPQADGIA
jgi:hypothetical protein